MKTVFSNAQAAHVWAQQSQDRGRGSSVSFRGPAFLSYNTVIAKFVRTTPGPFPNDFPRDVVLFSSQSYSKTTDGKHKSHAWRAIHGDVPNYTVPTIERGGWNHEDLDHTVNLAYLVERYCELGERLMRSSKLYADTESNVQALMSRSLHVATSYARDFNLPDPAPREISPASAARQIWARASRLDPTRQERIAAHMRARTIAEAADAAREAIARLDYALREYRSFRALGLSDPHARTSATINAARQFQVTRETVRALLNAALAERHNSGVFDTAQFLGG